MESKIDPTVQALLAELTKESSLVRQKEIVKLLEPHTDSAIPSLIERLEDHGENYHIRQNALEVLALSADERSILPLLKQLEIEPGWVGHVLNLLRQGLKEKDKQAQHKVIEQLIKYLEAGHPNTYLEPLEPAESEKSFNGFIAGLLKHTGVTDPDAETLKLIEAVKGKWVRSETKSEPEKEKLPKRRKILIEIITTLSEFEGLQDPRVSGLLSTSIREYRFDSIVAEHARAALAKVGSPVNQLINQLLMGGKSQPETIARLVEIGKSALPELLTAFRVNEFRHAQNSMDSNSLRSISTALLGITDNEKNPLEKDRLTLAIINAMAIHLDWQIDISPSDHRHKKAFDDNLYNKSFEAAWVLGRLKSVHALPHLFKAIKNRAYHPTVRENALTALGEIGDEQAIPHLIEIIDTHDYNIHFAIDALVKIGRPAAVPPLLNSLENVLGLDTDERQASLIWGLGQLRDPRANPKLIEWVKTHKADMKAVAIQALGSIGDPSAIPILEICLKDGTLLHRQDMGGTFWLFRTYRRRRICDLAFEALQQIGTSEALDIIQKWPPPANKNT